MKLLTKHLKFVQLHGLYIQTGCKAAITFASPRMKCSLLAVFFGTLISTGPTMKRALLMAFISRIAAFVGLAAGVPLVEEPRGAEWVVAFTAGVFLYVSLAAMVCTYIWIQHEEFNLVAVEIILNLFNSLVTSFTRKRIPKNHVHR